MITTKRLLAPILALACLAGPVTAANARQRPAVKQFTFSPTKFAAAHSAAAASQGEIGTNIGFQLSTRATVRIAIARRVTGRRSGARCVKAAGKLRNRAACTRYVRKGKLTRAQQEAGQRTIAFNGRIAGRALHTGTYRATITAVDRGGRRSHARRARFTVVRAGADQPATPPTAPAPAPAPAPTPPGGFPNAMNTGVRPGWTPSQTTNGNLTVTTNGAVIDGMLVTGSILVRAQNVTVKNTWVYGQIYNQVSGQGYNGLLIQDTDVGPPSGVSSLSDGAIGVGGFTALRVHIHNAEEGFRVGGYGSSGNKLGPVDIEDSFVELAKGACSHNDGIQGYDEPTRTTIRHNTIDTRASGPDCTTGAIFIGNGGADLITIQNNLLLGGGYSLRMGPGGTYDHVTGNRIVNGTWGYGPALVSSCGAVQQWADNSIVTIDANYQVAGTVRALNTC